MQDIEFMSKSTAAIKKSTAHLSEVIKKLGPFAALLASAGGDHPNAQAARQFGESIQESIGAIYALSRAVESMDQAANILTTAAKAVDKE